MATAHYPNEHPDRTLDSFINHQDLSHSAKQAKGILDHFDDLFVPRVQYKPDGVKNTCWYVAFREYPDIWIMNFTITPANVNFEFRIPKCFLGENDFSGKFGMTFQNSLQTFSLSRAGEQIVDIISFYKEKAYGLVLSGKHKNRGKSTAEFFIRKDLEDIFPDCKIRHGERPIQFGNSFLEIDLFVKEKNLAIEVQGPTHYKNIYNNLRDVLRRDQVKIDWCKSKNIKLFHIEWDWYMKTIYKMKAFDRRDVTQKIITDFLNSNKDFDIFCNPSNEVSV